jgi:IclR family transcriptional regulator, pca regulon regulatory protein
MPRKKTDSQTQEHGGRSVPSLREPRFSQSLERGLAILSSFSPDRPIRGIADLADDLGMSRSTTHRYVVTLVALGYLEQDARRKYRLGLKVTDLGMSALGSMSLRDHAHPYLEELRRETNFTVNLAILDGDEVLYVDRLRGSRPGQHKIDFDLHIGSRMPAYCTAMGKIMLAHLPESEQKDLVAQMQFSKQGPNAISSRKALRAELESLRDESVAVNDEELGVDIQAIAAPVRGSGGEVRAAVNLVASRSMITVNDLVISLSPHLLSTASRISARLGYRRADELN